MFKKCLGIIFGVTRTLPRSTNRVPQEVSQLSLVRTWLRCSYDILFPKGEFLNELSQELLWLECLSCTLCNPPKERVLRTLTNGSLWFECSLSLYIIVNYLGFPQGIRRTYSEVWWVVGGGWRVCGWGVFQIGVFSSAGFLFAICRIF